ncbi:hypothetical protein SSX86_032865 [Deinandra increscens subsp. villosa]|uniref:Uncharacterized protein n=1 Tax=Deinandra increscens subsp. villosa TaxID=3103831 RepID=A0AAP0C710_9ASTR
MGRAPCCDKVGLKKGPWTPEEDQKLLAYIEENGHGSWRALPAKAGLQRCGKSCRLRWTNYLRPDIKRGKFTVQEEQTIIQLHALLGNRWSAIATHLPKRTDNEIKNYWNTHLKKRLAKMGIDPVSHKPKNTTLLSIDGQSKSVANLSHMAQWESARLEAEARLVKQSRLQCTSQNTKQVGSLDQPSTVSDKLFPPVSGAPTSCLDILKALNRVWSSKAGNGNGSGDLESSPTSTLSTTGGVVESSTNLFEFVSGKSSRSCDDGTTGEECDEEWEFKAKDHMVNSTPRFNGINMSSIDNNNNNNEHISRGNFLENFTDLLLSNSGTSNHRNVQADGESNIGLAPSGDNNSYYEENNKNYWNNILNLVNSSLQDPPLF